MLNQEMNDFEEYSASSTVITFDPPLPLLRGPLPAGLSKDEPSIKGPFVLAFKDSQTWKSALQASQSKIRTQCEEGARIGCSISASSNCKPPWWRILFGAATVDFSERERCEEREMSACIALSKQSCLKFANDKCLIPFQDARISLIDQEKFLKCISDSRRRRDSQSSNSQQLLSKFSFEVTNYRGSDLLDFETSKEDPLSEGQ